MGVAFKPITAVIGAFVEGIDLNKDGKAAGDELYDALLKHHVLVFRDQDLTPEAHIGLAESFGPVVPFHPFYPSIEGHPPIAVITDSAESPPENELWHSDLSATEHPPFGSVLRSRLIPPVGGDTLWCSMHAIYESLSEPMRRYVDAAISVHRLAVAYTPLMGNNKFDGRAEALRNNKPEVHHPIALPHPTTGRKLVYVNGAYTSHILGVPEQESRMILDTLYAMCSNPKFNFRLRWANNTVVIWDNYATQHSATGDHYPQRRIVERVTIKEDRRAAAAAARPAVMAQVA